MSDNFGIAIGWNVPTTSIADFVPYQPLTPGLQYTRRTKTVGGLMDEGPFIRFMFEIMTETDYQAMLTQAGIYSLKMRQVMLHAQDDNYEWTYLNGIAHKPLNEGRRGFHLRYVPLLITGIHLATVP